MSHLLFCSCGEVLVKSFNGTTKVRSKVVIFRDDNAYVVCKGCNAEIPIPISLNKIQLLKSINKNPKLLVYDKSL